MTISGLHIFVVDLESKQSSPNQSGESDEHSLDCRRDGKRFYLFPNRAPESRRIAFQLRRLALCRCGRQRAAITATN